MARKNKEYRSKDGRLEIADFVAILRDKALLDLPILSVMRNHDVATSVFYSSYNYYIKNAELRDFLPICRRFLENPELKDELQKAMARNDKLIAERVRLEHKNNSMKLEIERLKRDIDRLKAEKAQSFWHKFFKR